MLNNKLERSGSCPSRGTRIAASARRDRGYLRETSVCIAGCITDGGGAMGRQGLPFVHSLIQVKLVSRLRFEPRTS
jgi:hypothetical protein